MQERSEENLEKKGRRKKYKVEQKAVKSAKKSNAKKQRRTSVAPSLRSSPSTLSTPNDGSETNTLSVASPRDGNNNAT